MKKRTLGFIYILLFFGVITGPLVAQNKIEREFGIKEKEVPKEASDWLYDAFETTKRPKWYKELSESGFSYEAKFKHEGKFHSVEFDSLGRVEDVEIELKVGELSKEAQSGLNTYFSGAYKNSDLKRIQIQYSGEPNDLEDFFDENMLEGILIHYEIEYIGLDEFGDSQLWEGLFSDGGLLLSKRKIILSPSENLIF